MALTKRALGGAGADMAALKAFPTKHLNSSLFERLRRPAGAHGAGRGAHRGAD